MKGDVVKVAVVALMVGVVPYGFAGGGARTFSLAPMGNAGDENTQPAAADSGETVKVQGRGVGVDKTAALKDAYRDAIERAVGLYVDAETAANNDQIVKDQILTQSNAYITDYREIEEKRLDGGLVQLRILATVKKVALTTKLSGVMPAQTVAINNTGLQNVHAQLVTKEKRAEDAAALLKNALDGIDPMKSLMVASIRPETQKIIIADDASGGGQHGRKSRGSAPAAGSVTLRYLFEVKFDRAKYFAEFVPNLKKVLDQISLTPPKEIRLMELMPDNNRRQEDVDKFKQGDTSEWHTDVTLGKSIFGFCDYEGTKGFLDPLHVYAISLGGGSYVFEFYNRFRPKSGGSFSWSKIEIKNDAFDERFRKNKVQFALITQLNADCSNGKVTMYELDKSVIDILNDWRSGLLEKDSGGGSSFKLRQRRLAKGSGVGKTTNYNIILLDKNGEEIGVYPWQIPNGVLMNVKFAELPGSGMVYATPFVGCFGENFIQWRDFVLERDQLAKIASVKIELVD